MNTFDDHEYTIERANQTLPLIRVIVEDVVKLADEIADTRERLDYLSGDRDLSSQTDDYSKELDAIEQFTDLKSDRLDTFLEELDALDVDNTYADDGYVDFPAIRNDQPVCLCWRLGETNVAFWHPIGEECSHRRPIDLAMIRQSGSHRQREVV